MSADGGSAFPQVFTEDPDERRGESFPNTYSTGGMSLRDWFAGQALQGWLASFAPDAPHPVKNDVADEVASNAYAMADAMLAARQQPKEDGK